MFAPLKKPYRKVCEDMEESLQSLINLTNLLKQDYEQVTKNVEFFESLDDEWFLSDDNQKCLKQLTDFHRGYENAIYACNVIINKFRISHQIGPVRCSKATPVENCKSDSVDVKRGTVNNTSDITKNDKGFFSSTNDKQNECTDIETNSNNSNLYLGNIAIGLSDNRSENILSDNETKTTICTDVNRKRGSITVSNDTVRQCNLEPFVPNKEVLPCNKPQPRCASFSYEEYLANRGKDDMMLAKKFYEMSRPTFRSNSNSIALNNANNDAGADTDASSKSSVSFNTCDDASLSDQAELDYFSDPDKKASCELSYKSESDCQSPVSVIECEEKSAMSGDDFEARMLQNFDDSEKKQTVSLENKMNIDFRLLENEVMDKSNKSTTYLENSLARKEKKETGCNAKDDSEKTQTVLLQNKSNSLTHDIGGEMFDGDDGGLFDFRLLKCEDEDNSKSSSTVGNGRDINISLENSSALKKKVEAESEEKNTTSFTQFKLVKKVRKVDNMSSPENSTQHKLTSSPSEVMKKKVTKQNGEFVENKGDTRRNESFELKEKHAPKIGDRCFVSYTKSPSEFYIHIIDEYIPEIDRLKQQIHKVYHDTLSENWFSSKAAAKNSLSNSRSCVVYVDPWQEWCRAEIIDWLEDDHTDDVKVQLVDFGNYMLVPYNNLRELLKFISELPKLVHKCHLAHVVPKDGKEWNDKAKEVFGHDGNFSEVFIINNLFWESQSYALELLTYENEEDVALMLIDAGIAKIIDEEDIVQNDFFLEQMKHAIGLDKDDDDDDDLNEIGQYKNVNELVIGYNPKDHFRLCSFVRPDGTCFKHGNCRLEHNPRAKEILRNLSTTDQQACFSYKESCSFFDTIGDEVEVLITSISSINRFYAQILDSSGRNEFKLLYKNMNLESTVKRYQKIPPGEVLSIGEMVIVYYQAENHWLRARILSINYCTQDYEIYIIDFGDEDVCHRNDLWVLPDHFMELPPQAIECRLVNVKQKQNVNQEAAKEHFESIAHTRQFCATVLYKELFLGVKLKDKTGADVGLKLIQAGYADLEMEFIASKNPRTLVD